MDCAFIVDPLPELKAYKDSSVAMKRALSKRGHRAYSLQPTAPLCDARSTRPTLAHDNYGDVIVKPVDGLGRTSVFRIRGGDPNRNVIIETVSQNGARTVMAQRYIPEIGDGDKRVLLIAGKAVPYSLARIPKPGETR